MKVREILARTPPKLLYHYTTQAGLLGVMKSKEIWASHTQYLNDQREFRHAIGIVEDELRKLRNRESAQEASALIDEMEKGLKGIESINVCVCSFSEHGDVLSQWRAYGGGSAGFSIGFSGQYLRTVSDREEFWLVPCLYAEEEQRTLLRTLLEEVLEENRHNRAAGKELHQPPGGNLVAYLNRYAPILKHASFSEELEWRIVSRPLACTSERFDYRPGMSMLIPYYRIPLVDFALEEIIVGPTPHKTQSRRSVQGLLVRHGLDKVKVRNSQAPYRTW